MWKQEFPGTYTWLQNLSDEVKDEIFPISSECVQAWHRSNKGESLPFKIEHMVFPSRPDVPYGNKDAPRMVFPGPSATFADVEMKQEDTGKYALYASKDVATGKKFYDLWQIDWPFRGA